MKLPPPSQTHSPTPLGTGKGFRQPLGLRLVLPSSLKRWLGRTTTPPPAPAHCTGGCQEKITQVGKGRSPQRPPKPVCWKEVPRWGSSPRPGQLQEPPACPPGSSGRSPEPCPGRGRAEVCGEPGGGTAGSAFRRATLLQGGAELCPRWKPGAESGSRGFPAHRAGSGAAVGTRRVSALQGGGCLSCSPCPAHVPPVSVPHPQRFAGTPAQPTTRRGPGEPFVCERLEPVSCCLGAGGGLSLNPCSVKCHRARRRWLCLGRGDRLPPSWGPVLTCSRSQGVC